MYVIAGVLVITNKRATPTSVFLSFKDVFLRWTILIVIKSPIPVTSCLDMGDRITVIAAYVILAMAEIRNIRKISDFISALFFINSMA